MAHRRRHPVGLGDGALLGGEGGGGVLAHVGHRLGVGSADGGERVGDALDAGERGRDREQHVVADVADGAAADR